MSRFENSSVGAMKYLSEMFGWKEEEIVERPNCGYGDKCVLWKKKDFEHNCMYKHTSQNEPVFKFCNYGYILATLIQSRLDMDLDVKKAGIEGLKQIFGDGTNDGIVAKGGIQKCQQELAKMFEDVAGNLEFIISFFYVALIMNIEIVDYQFKNDNYRTTLTTQSIAKFLFEQKKIDIKNLFIQLFQIMCIKHSKIFLKKEDWVEKILIRWGEIYVDYKTAEKKKEESLQICVVCRDENHVVNRMVEPCMHVCLCEDCEHLLTHYKNDKCPYCKTKYTKISKVFNVK